jgi:hypothetical protein
MRTAESSFKLYTGRHSATFVGVEEQIGKHGPCLLWKFVVTYGYHRTFVNRFTKAEPTSGSDCARFLSRMLGKPVTVDDLPWLRLHIGKSFTINVDYHNGYPQVKDVIGPEETDW